MTNKFNLGLILVFIISISMITIIGSGSTQKTKPLVIATTSLGREFAENIGKDLINIETIIPSGQCPSHYDVKVSEAISLSQASLVIYHGVEPWLDQLLAASENTEVKRFNTKPYGQWYTPPNAITIIAELGNTLAEVDPDNAHKYLDNADQYIETVSKTIEEIKKEADRQEVEKAKVIVMQWQKSFVSWLGFQVAGDYPPPEFISAKEYNQLAMKCCFHEISLIVDNKQSGTKIGAKLAKDTGAKHVVLTNFPGGLPGTDTYPQMIKYNADALFDALKRYREDPVISCKNNNC